MKMSRARAAYAAEHMTVHEVLDDEGKVKAKRRARKQGSPGFRAWARDTLRKTKEPLSPKLQKIVGGAP